MLKRIAADVRRLDWFSVGIEVLVVMIGLMLAFQLDRWREGFVERRQEQSYVAGIVADIETDIPTIEYAIALQSLRLEFVDLLMEIAAAPAVATKDPILFLAAVHQAAYTYTPVLKSHTIENLRATGDLRLIRDESLKRAMFDYYSFDQSQQQFRPIQFETEFRHFELAAGVLSYEQEVFIQDNWRILSPRNFELAKASQGEVGDILAAARRLQERPQLIAWLPYVRDMQLEQLALQGVRGERAQPVLTMLNGPAGAIQ